MVAESRVTVDGHELHYLTAGSGPPLVLLHGGIVDSAALTWGGVIDELANYREVVALDMLGYGKNAVPDVTYTTDLHIDMLAGAIDALGYDSSELAVGGLSLGGAVALGYTLRASSQVSNLILVSSHGLTPAPPNRLRSFVFSRIPHANKLALRIVSRDRELLRMSLDGIVHNPARLPEEVIDELSGLMERPNPGTAYRRWRKQELSLSGYRTDYRDQLPELTVPTLLIHGREDEIYSPEWAEQASERIPTAQLEILEECGHWPPREHPADVVDLIREFLEH